MSKIHRCRPLGYRFALGALDAAERLRQVSSREAVQQMVYDQLRILGATQRTTSQLTNANGQVERQMSREPSPGREGDGPDPGSRCPPVIPAI